MVKARILVVEDDENILELIRYNLDKDGYAVDTANCGEEGLKSAIKLQPDLIILDLMLPGMDGLEVCRALKGDIKTKSSPVVMVTAKGEEEDIITGLEMGADDYITKPFSTRVLAARIKAILRRKKEIQAGIKEKISIHDIFIDLVKYEVKVGGGLLKLTSTEFKLLKLMAESPGRVFTRTQIVDGVHGDDYPVTDRSVDVQIVGLRKKLGKTGEFIETIRGVGYRFKE